MPKSRKRKAPVTTADGGGSTSTSTSQSGRVVIRQFHVLLKRQAQLQNSQNSIDNARALADVEDQITKLGGLERYQRMSAVGQGNDRGGGAERVLIEWLKDMGVNKPACTKLRLLEVGALKHDNYRSCSPWIDCTPIDLRSRHPSIIEQDFLLLDQEEHREKWDVISLSLVLNFVPVPKDRGRMLRFAHDMLVSRGYLFLTYGFKEHIYPAHRFLTKEQLPLPCVANSRYLDFAHLKALMDAIGFVELKDRWKEGGKMIYLLYQKLPRTNHDFEGFTKKSSFRQGNRNNFCVLL